MATSVVVAPEWSLADPLTWSWTLLIAVSVGVLVGMEVLTLVCTVLFTRNNRIPVKASHHDTLDAKDWSFIVFNRAVTAPVMLAMWRFTFMCDKIDWGVDSLTFLNTVGALTLLFLVYDLFYTWFHRILHWRSLYPLVHKHHHRQHSPTRGVLDAVNVHPFEYVTGELLHQLALFLVTAFDYRVHAYTVAVFMILAGIAATLNHTRYDVRVPPSVYDTRVHDVHHRIPDVNFGQYITVWDRLFGFYRPYNAAKTA